MYAFHCPIPSHPSSIRRIWVKHDFPVSFIASIAIDKRSRLIIKALHLPSWLNSLPQSTMTFFSVRFPYISYNVKANKRKTYHTIYILLPRFLLKSSVTFFQNLSPSSSSGEGTGMTFDKVSNLFIFFYMFSSHSSSSLRVSKLAVTPTF